MANTIEERVEGYRVALASAGIPFDEELVIHSSSNIDEAHAGGLRLLELHELLTAVFCTNNFMTLGMIRALATKGLRCPEDVAVVGFDDFPWASAFQPRLTVVAQPSYAIGEEAVGLLFDRISRKRSGAAVRLMLNARLVIRESCGSQRRLAEAPPRVAAS